MTVVVVNDTLQEETADIADWQDSWIAKSVKLPSYAVLTLALLGMVGNGCCFKTANFMPKSNFTSLMKHMAVWDILAANFYSILFLLLGRHLGIFFVSLSPFLIQIFYL